MGGESKLGNAANPTFSIFHFPFSISFTGWMRLPCSPPTKYAVPILMPAPIIIVETYEVACRPWNCAPWDERFTW